MKQFLLFVLLSLLFVFQALAQTNNYWQQEVHYQIDVKLNPPEKTYTGEETLLYINHSPDTLKFIWLHLYPNAYRDESTAFSRQQEAQGKTRFHFSSVEQRGYLNLKSVVSNGDSLKFKLKEKNIDECQVFLNKPLNPGDTLRLKIAFKGKFPRVFSRMGTWDSDYFAATQWYPKMVVYDRTGWHPDSYLDQGEFYGDYGTFDVRITLPEAYVIDATGMLQDNPKEEAFMQQLVDTTQYFISLDRKARKKFIKQWIKDKNEQLDYNKTKTVRFYAENVHDFAWFAGLHYMVFRRVHNGGVLTNVLVHPKSAYQWRHVPEYAERTISFYGSHVGRYQYPKASVVQGELKAGGGMEYPMITIISSQSQDWSHFLEMVVMHEIGHNWFMGMLGSDERVSTFLDEGMNSFLELKYLEHYYGKGNLTDFKKLFKGFNLMNDLGEWQLVHITYGNQVSRRADQPLNLRAEKYSPTNYGAINYHKGVALLNALEWYLTPSVFWKGMHTYFDRWNGKHPTVEDFFNVMEEVSGKSLDWFVDEWYNSTHVSDFVVDKVKTQKTASGYKTEVYVKNKGTMKRMPAPVFLITSNGDTLIKRWEANPQKPVIFEHNAPAKKVIVNANHQIFETNYWNNQNGLPPIEVKFFPQIPSFETYQIVLMPYLWKEDFVDKWRLGVSFWTGNPIINLWMVSGKIYYGFGSKRTSFDLSIRNRFHLPFANYSDLALEGGDADGMQRLAFSARNVFLDRANDLYSSALTLRWDMVNLYNLDYNEPHFFETAKYGVLHLGYAYKLRKMLDSWYFNVSAEKGLKVNNSGIDFWKFEMEGSWYHRFTKTIWLKLRGYVGRVTGSQFPVQESIFAVGDIDPRHQKSVFQRRGFWAPGRNYIAGGGMQMYGYNDPQNTRFFAARNGAAVNFSFKIWRWLPTLYASAGVLNNSLSDLFKQKAFAETGIKVSLPGLKFVLPLYLSDPLPGEKHLAFRWSFHYSFPMGFGF